MNKCPHSRAFHEAGHALAFWWNGQPIRRISVRTKVEACAGPLFDLRGKPRFMIKALPLAPSGSDESHYLLALHCFLKREASQWVLLEVLDVLA